MQKDEIICPLTDKKITHAECYDIAMVIEGLAPEHTIREDIKPENISKCKKDCMACKYHPQ